MYDWNQHRAVMANVIRNHQIPEDLIDDLIQDTLVELIERNVDAEGIEEPRNFAAAAARGNALNWVAKTGRQRVLSTEDSLEVETVVQDGETHAVSQGVSPETQAVNTDLLQKALGSLTNKQANAIFLVDYMGYTFQEGADHRGVSKASFHRTYKRAKEGLKRWAASQR